MDDQRTKAFGLRIRALREAAGLTQEDLAAASGLHRAMVGFIERGEREVTLPVIFRLADGLKTSAQDLMAIGADRNEWRLT